VNLGFLDCAALIEVLARELANGADPGALAELRVLRRYERWRKSENMIALGLVDGLNRLFSTSDATLGSIRRAGLGAVDASALAKRFFMGRAMGTSGELPAVARVAP
jgi:2-polyprenyl-6-methoxyphenol hydroxylase-like FAD-dependent oxidoreductase